MEPLKGVLEGLLIAALIVFAIIMFYQEAQPAPPCAAGTVCSFPGN